LTLEYLKHKTKEKRDHSIYSCLEEIKSSWRGNVGGLIQDWAEIAGEQLALNCTPLNIQNKVLTIGASHPQWRQALQYNRLELIKSLKIYGYKIKDIRIRQYYPADPITRKSEKEIWEKHPSRTDKNGIINCPFCKVPTPKGEVKLWGKCSFCRRKELEVNGTI
tara:strand:- start:944 stop:1435 length:492 start_codon:yes stop_codon:yes gene_type:complete